MAGVKDSLKKMTRKLELINTIVLINTAIQTTEVHEF